MLLIVTQNIVFDCIMDLRVCLYSAIVGEPRYLGILAYLKRWTNVIHSEWSKNQSLGFKYAVKVFQNERLNLLIINAKRKISPGA